MAYKYGKAIPTDLKVNKSYKGESIEQKINRIVNNKEPIEDSAPIIYTDRKDGVLPDYNIRTDKWDAAIDAMDKVDQKHKQDRLDRLKDKTPKETPKDEKPKENTGGESTQATGEADKP